MYFNPRAPCGARLQSPQIWICLERFQPTRPLRGATKRTKMMDNNLIFQPTRPLRGATGGYRQVQRGEGNFNPRAPCGARPYPDRAAHRRACISTHAPLAGRDLRRQQCGTERKYFNPRAPCGARPAACRRTESRELHFNPRAPCGARHHRPQRAQADHRISTHAPLAGRDRSPGRTRPSV